MYVWEHLQSESLECCLVRTPLPVLGPRCWDTCLFTFYDLRIFPAFVFDFLIFYISIRNLSIFRPTPGVFLIAFFPFCFQTVLSWLQSGGSSQSLTSSKDSWLSSDVLENILEFRWEGRYSREKHEKETTANDGT